MNSVQAAAYSEGFEAGKVFAKSMAEDEVKSLRSQLEEAKEIIAKLTDKWVEYEKLFEGISDEDASRHDIEILDVDLATLRRARSFLSKENGNG